MQTLLHAHANLLHSSHSDRHTRPAVTRRGFFSQLLGGSLAGASVLELGLHRAAWARALAATATPKLFDIEKVADGVYCALARAQAMVNSNAAIFERSEDVLIVDAHSKPSAAASLITQIKKEVTSKPVRFVVNSHFHWDHTQGNSAYRAAFPKADFVASEATKEWMAKEAQNRLKESLEDGLKQIDGLKTRMSKAASGAEKSFCREQIRQIEAYRAEMASFSMVLPTITFADTHVLKDQTGELHLEFHGHAHTAGDVVVVCPQKRVVATGDMIHGVFPFIADGFPKSWPKTIDAVGSLEFDHILPGHGPVQQGRQRMNNMRNYIEELTGRVAEGKKAGQSLADLKKSITAASLKSLQSDGYREYLAANLSKFFPSFGPPAPLQNPVNTNIEEIEKNLDRI